MRRMCKRFCEYLDLSFSFPWFVYQFPFVSRKYSHRPKLICHQKSHQKTQNNKVWDPPTQTGRFKNDILWRNGFVGVFSIARILQTQHCGTQADIVDLEMKRGIWETRLRTKRYCVTMYDVFLGPFYGPRSLSWCNEEISGTVGSKSGTDTVFAFHGGSDILFARCWLHFVDLLTN